MTQAGSFELEWLLQGHDAQAREGAWADLVRRHSRLLRSVARETGPRTHDEVMDRYTYILERLREHDYRRLRMFRADGTAKFSTWLVVVARRLCMDRHREVYGRLRRGPDEASRRRRALQGIGTHSGDDLLVNLPDTSAPEIEDVLDRDARHQALAAAVSTLPPADQLLIRLRFTDEVPVREIAMLLHLPTPFHVYRRINAVLETLRHALAAGPREPGA